MIKNAKQPLAHSKARSKFHDRKLHKLVRTFTNREHKINLYMETLFMTSKLVFAEAFNNVRPDKLKT